MNFSDIDFMDRLRNLTPADSGGSKKKMEPGFYFAKIESFQHKVSVNGHNFFEVGCRIYRGYDESGAELPTVQMKDRWWFTSNPVSWDISMAKMHVLGIVGKSRDGKNYDIPEGMDFRSPEFQAGGDVIGKTGWVKLVPQKNNPQYLEIQRWLKKEAVPEADVDRVLGRVSAGDLATSAEAEFRASARSIEDLL